MNREDYDVFRTNYLVNGLDDDSVRRLTELAEIHEAPEGAKLIAQGETGSDLIVILRGLAKVWCCNKQLGEKGPGAVVGEVALLDNGPRSADVVAATPVTYALFDGTTLKRFMAGNRDAGFLVLLNLSRVLSLALREATQQIEDLKAEAREPAHP